MRRLTFYDTKSDTLYILGDIILPNTKGLDFRSHCKAIDDAFKMSFEDRLEKYATDSEKQIVREEMKKHPGCKLSEFSTL